jgi:N-acetyl-anhydromuramyl-L-alanine amidase AmpD
MKVPNVRFVQGKNTYKDADGKHYGMAIHNTSNNANDTDESTNATHRTDGVSAHFYVDADSITQSLDTDARAGHAGSSEGNQNAIAWEFTGTNDKSRAWWLANICWDEVGRVMAYIITHDPDFKTFQVRHATVAQMKSNPKVQAFYSHNDMRLAWGGTTHDDPGPNFPWDRLINVVNSHLVGGGPEEDMNQDQNGWLKFLFDLFHNGGPDAGVMVPGPSGSPTNALVNKIDYAVNEIEAVKTAIGSGIGPGPIDYTALAKALLAEIAPHS